MSEPRGIVQRLSFSQAGLPSVEYLTRDLDVLLTHVEWSWGEKRKAHVFPSYAGCEPPNPNRSATDHVAVLKANGVEHVYPVVYNRDVEQALGSEKPIPAIVPEPEHEKAGPPPRRARRLRHVDPADVFAREEKRHLA